MIDSIHYSDHNTQLQYPQFGNIHNWSYDHWPLIRHHWHHCNSTVVGHLLTVMMFTCKEILSLTAVVLVFTASTEGGCVSSIAEFEWNAFINVCVHSWSFIIHEQWHDIYTNTSESRVVHATLSISAILCFSFRQMTSHEHMYTPGGIHVQNTKRTTTFMFGHTCYTKHTASHRFTVVFGTRDTRVQIKPCMMLCYTLPLSLIKGYSYRTILWTTQSCWQNQLHWVNSYILTVKQLAWHNATERNCKQDVWMPLCNCSNLKMHYFRVIVKMNHDGFCPSFRP